MTKMLRTMNLRRKMTTLTGIVALALTATACTGTANTANGVAAEPAEGTETLAFVEDSPLREYQNILYGLNMTQEEVDREREADHLRKENLTAQCMQDAGFEYIPRPSMPKPPQGEPARPDDLDYVAQYGFGLTVSPARPDGDYWSNVPEYEDPNQEYFDTLSADAQNSYLRALNGSGEGCSDIAYQTVQANKPWAVADTMEFWPLTDAMQKMFQDVAATVTDADRDWVECMADAGHPGYKNRSDLFQKLTEKSNTEINKILQSWDWDSGLPMNIYNSAELAAFHDYEVEIAVADVQCSTEVNYNARNRAYGIEIETQFVKDHKAELESLRNAIEQRAA